MNNPATKPLQVNLTEDERAEISAAARKAGIAGVSTFMRMAALKEARAGND